MRLHLRFEKTFDKFIRLLVECWLIWSPLWEAGRWAKKTWHQILAPLLTGMWPVPVWRPWTMDQPSNLQMRLGDKWRWLCKVWCLNLSWSTRTINSVVYAPVQAARSCPTNSGPSAYTSSTGVSPVWCDCISAERPVVTAKPAHGMTHAAKCLACRVLLLNNAHVPVQQPQLTPANYCGLSTVGNWVILQHVIAGNMQWKLHKACSSWGNEQ